MCLRNILTLIIMLCSMALFPLFGQEICKDSLLVDLHPPFSAAQPDSSFEIFSEFDWKSYQPLPIPQWQPPRTSGLPKNQLVRYNLSTKNEFTSEPDTTVAFPNLIPGMPGIAADLDMDDGFPNNTEVFTNLFPIILSTVAYPFSTTVKLFLSYPNGNFVATGVLIDPFHILTAGHVIYDDVNDTWVNSVIAIPSFSGGTPYFGRANAVELYSWSGWTQDHSIEWDMGYIRLDRPVGALTGTLGYGFNDDNSFFTNNSFRQYCYPAESPYPGNKMYTWFGEYDQATTHILYHNNIGYGGMSGSGSYKRDVANRYVYAVLSHGIDNRTGDTRINSQRFNSIRNRILNNTPANADLIALDVDAGPSSPIAGNRLDHFSYVIHNYSRQNWSGTVQVRVYLSSNRDISESDILLQTRSFTGSISAKQSVRINSTGILPKIPAYIQGQHWLGVILDINDVNTNNNDTDGDDAEPLLIQSLTAIPDEDNNLNNGFALFQNYPNPFNPETEIEFYLPDNSHIKFEIFDITGRRVRILHNGILPSGRQSLRWDGRDEKGVSAPSGVYIYRLSDDQRNSQTRKMMLLR
ncbi:MAG: T9SS type A sorting domain-containing protein [Calditrichaeota bacterium]|nr:T9SS type A sorting domain-containing protein [Calditrichota bacterium]